MIRELFHTQEKWHIRLRGPKETTNPDAWFGKAFYFWYYEDDAVWWGNTAKKRFRYYEIYKASVNCDKILDTVFNEEHYNFWIDQIDRAINNIVRKSTKKITLSDINEFFKAKGVFDDLDGIMFQDITDNPAFYFVKEFQYKKRIQIAVYNLDIISNFAFTFEGKCV